MLNNNILIGRIVNTPELKKTENGREVTNITVAVPRSFKNVNGEYDTDFIDCTMWMGTAKTTVEYCKKGDLIALKGRLQSTLLDKENIPKINLIQFIVEKVSFLSKAKEEKI